MGIKETAVFVVGAVLIVVGSLAATGHVTPARGMRATAETLRPQGIAAVGLGAVVALMGFLMLFGLVSP
ncbi:MAG: hypothetical protein KJ051_09135 [Thermoleophilia bacterium]|nr:hypothetical protein [Thermoleophilia bacterium]